MNLKSTVQINWSDNYYKIKVLFHFIYFSLFIFIALFGYNYSLETYFSRWILCSDVFEGFAVTGVVYVYYYQFFRKQILITKKIAWLFSCVIILSLLAANKEYYSYVYSDYEYEIIDVFNQLLIYIGLSGTLLSFLWFIENLRNIFHARLFAKLNALKEAKNKLLRQQLNSHFLFNALNSIYSMSLSNNPKTSDTILKLSSMMRYLTDNSFVNKVKLSAEVRFIQEYIDLEKIRFGKRANIQFEQVGIEKEIFIEPLLLISLVENAFKHGFYINDANSFVFISLKKDANTLYFKVENSVQIKKYFQSEEREGQGLDNLNKRLKIAYPRSSKLELLDKEDKFVAKLQIGI